MSVLVDTKIHAKADTIEAPVSFPARRSATTSSARSTLLDSWIEIEAHGAKAAQAAGARQVQNRVAHHTSDSGWRRLSCQL